MISLSKLVFQGRDKQIQALFNGDAAQQIDLNCIDPEVN
jgi:hypothetical protein